MRLGFIGGSGHHYLRGFVRDEPAMEFATASDGHDPQASRTFAESIGTAQWFDDPLRMLDEFKPEIVSIGGMYGYNGELAAAALERNLPTVSDKPIAATWAQLDRLRELARDPSRVLLTEFDFRSRPDFRAARDAVAAGLIGKVVLATSQKSYRFGQRPTWYRDRSSYGGTLLWILSHSIDLIPFVTNQSLGSVVGHQGNVSRPDYATMEDHVAAMFKLSGGGTAVVHADYLRPKSAATHGDDRLRVAGSDGVVEVRDYRCKLMTTDQPEVDITDRAKTQPIHLELLSALRGESSDLYSTKLSLATAETLLRARDVIDNGTW